MIRYITLNGDVYVKTVPTFWTRERVMWGATLLTIVSAVATRLYKKFGR